MSNLVIVAIPDENDRVWKVSSEKVPHLTLLFLGDVDKVSNVDQIVQFVEHAANTTLRRFYLSVDRRGELGEDQADVLFFRKHGYDCKQVHEFRDQLLKNDNIRTAYDSTEQFEGPWKPHLTLGYPSDPAKTEESDQVYGFFDVQFNRIAVWVDDYDGPEFLLKSWDDWEALETVPMDVAMSDISVNEARVAAGVEAIEHYGTKGMKWGVRREVPQGSAVKGMFRSRGMIKKATGSRTMSRGAEVKLAIFGPAALFDAKVRGELRNVDQKVELFKADKTWDKQLKDGTAWVAVNNASADHFNKHIDALNKKYPDADWSKEDYSNPKAPDFKRYVKDVNRLSKESIEHAVNELYLKNPTGTKSVEITPSSIPGDFTMRVKDEAKHADDDSSIRIKLDYQFDDKGRVTGFTYSDDDPVETEIAQTEVLGAAFLAHQGLSINADILSAGEAYVLEHYGVKGMRWGVRREGAITTQTHIDTGLLRRRTMVEAKGGESHDAHPDAVKAATQKQKLKKSGTDALSTQELRDLAQRLQLEAQVKTLSTKKGQKFVAKQLETESKAVLRKGAGLGVAKAAPTAIKKVKKGAATAAVAALI